MTDKSEQRQSADADLERRLARLRARVAAESRPQDVQRLDQALAEAGRATKAAS